MKYSSKHLLGSVAVAALLMVAACDQNEEEQAGNAVPGEMESSERAVPMTSEPGGTTPGAMDRTADSTMPAGDMPQSNMPADDMPGSDMSSDDMSMGEEAAAENTDPATIAGTDDEAAGCQAAADALGSTWTGKSYSEAESEISAGEDVATIRVIRPDEAVTQDFRADRLNVELDADDNVSRVYCG